jgi:hypothetical protein
VALLFEVNKRKNKISEKKNWSWLIHNRHWKLSPFSLEYRRTYPCIGLYSWPQKPESIPPPNFCFNLSPYTSRKWRLLITAWSNEYTSTFTEATEMIQKFVVLGYLKKSLFSKIRHVENLLIRTSKKQPK